MTDSLQYTPIDAIPGIYTRLTDTFKSGVTRPLEWRKQQLRQLARLLYENKKAVEHAVWQDLRKPTVEATISEILGTVKSCHVAVNELEEWAAPTVPVVDASHSTWNAVTHVVPKGTVLIISPWNYPFTLTLKPMVGAIAAGCTVVLKPSELSSHSAALMATLVPRYLDPSAYAVVTGAVPETSALLDLRWDHIMYTGGGVVGRVVAAAAAKHLTPLTLELGGKSPAIIDDSCDLDLAAKRVLFGKSQNSGQLCVAPDYVVVVRSVYPAFIESLKKAYAEFWPEGPFVPSAQWGKIINERHAERLLNLMKTTKGEVIVGGQVERKDGVTRIAPTIYSNVPLDDVFMEEEIFGPFLPLIPVDTLDDAIRVLNGIAKPLLIYAFAKSEESKRKLLERTTSGQVSFNDTVSLLGADELPFGGVGDSGYGAWHGPHSFETFSQRRVCVDIPPEEETAFYPRYRPYTEDKYQILSGVVDSFMTDLNSRGKL